MSYLKKSAVITTLLSATLLLPTATMASVPDYSTNVASLANYLKANQAADGSITGFGGETSWTIMGLVAVGIDPHTIKNSGNSLIDFLKNNPPADTATTGWERDLLSVTAAGENPFTFGGHNYVVKVQSFVSGGQIGSNTLLNDDIFGILSLLSAGPSADQSVILGSIDFLISNQNSDGGWSYQVGGTSDNNDTAVAIEALQAAKNKGFSNSGLNSAVNNAINYLKANQNPDGGWGYAGTGNSDGASTAWAVQALLGDDSVVSAGLNFLVSLQDSSGGIQYQSGFGADTFTSSYGLSAFGQKSFPIGSFEGTFQEPSDGNQNSGQPTNNSPASDKNGQVLAATTLPDTGISATANNSTADYLLPVLAVIALGFGFGVKYLVIRLQRYGKSEKKIYEKA